MTTIKQLNHLPWKDRQFVSNVKRYLSDETRNIHIFPLPEDQGINMYKHRLKQRLSSLIMEDEEIYAIIHELPKRYKDENGQPLIHVELPLRLKFIETEEERKHIVINYYKDIQRNGLFSVHKLWDKLNLEFFPITKEDIKKYINTVSIKQMLAPYHEVITQPILTKRPWEHLEIDLFSMSRYSGANQHYTYILNIVDHFSKFVICRPLKTKEDKDIVKHLKQILIEQGPPTIISSDNGFRGLLIEELMNRFGIQQRFSLPYRPQTSGLVERLNGVIKHKLYAYMTEHNTYHWIDVLDDIVYAYNTSISHVNQLSPLSVLRGYLTKPNKLFELVQKRQLKKAEYMLSQSVIHLQHQLEPIHINDYVRISNLSLKTYRKQLKPSNMTAWSKSVHQVLQKQTKNRIELFKLSFAQQDTMEDRWFQRHELYKLPNDAIAIDNAFILTNQQQPIAEELDEQMELDEQIDVREQLNLDEHIDEQLNEELVNDNDDELEHNIPIPARKRSQRKPKYNRLRFDDFWGYT